MRMILPAILLLAAGTAAAQTPEPRFDGVRFGLSALRNDITNEEGSGSDRLESLHFETTGYGVYVGYDAAFPRFVLGGELAYIELGEDELEFTFETGATATVEADMGRLLEVRARIGRPFGRAMVYGALGYGHLDTDNGEFDGPVYGIGVEAAVDERGFVGLEYVEREFSGETDPGVDVRLDVSTIALRVGYRF